MFSVASPRCLYRRFLPLQLVFLSAAFVHSSASNGDQRDCWSSSAGDYRGQTQTSSSGLTCLNWTSVSQEYAPQTGVGDHNYCRNPDSSEKPWCYISGPDGNAQKQFCAIQPCRDQTSTAAASDVQSLHRVEASSASLQTNKSGSSQDEGTARQSVMGISQRVRSGSKQKKDLGMLGYILGSLMMAIIIILGAGITLGYFYKRGRDMKKQHEQRRQEREMQRINLPLSAFANPTCELVDENTIVITAQHEPTPVKEEADGADPLMGQQAGTPGA
ncbi:phosphoinositide-3-kinase-interacting protein 1 [Synchiropus splendidus]|uniref:phosphoinositide-3-kinase-interacting protein 1 n=1 Tax=Synchiropus splendidus TaxID=270530 RepID=UPI00237D6EFC|nr:phosphoinositide-3-kinase-interacting protein 1 [Synchiropus splendidus]